MNIAPTIGCVCRLDLNPFCAIQDGDDDEDFDVFDVDNGGDDGAAEADADDVDHH